jgi:DNA topoisomerase-1|tara:strand:+ start:6277 stop:7260 length:984 start_codon:yes stop_codon:yes gene_type:complete
MEQYIIRKISKKINKKYYHKYYHKEGKEIKDKDYIQKIIDGIYISPAYDNVKINIKKGKVRAIGYDTEGRPQYIYNKKFIEKQKDKKFDHMSAFGKKFSKINKQINEDLYSTRDSKEKQVAIILKLIMECQFRIGNEKYSKKYKSYGTTTLENKHIKVKRNSLIIDFIGKKKVRNTCTVKNKKVIKNLKEKKRTLRKNDRIFSYRKGDKYFNIQSSDVNNYLKQFGDFSAKNFRTWGANIEFIVQILKNCKDCNFPITKKENQNILKKSIQKVAKKLHNTESVCKSNYLDPELIKLFTIDNKGFLKQFNTKKKEELYKKYIAFLDNL